MPLCSWRTMYPFELIKLLFHSRLFVLAVLLVLGDCSGCWITPRRQGILSALIFQEKTQNEPPLTDRLQTAVAQVRRIPSYNMKS